MPTPRLIEHAGVLDELSQIPSFLEPQTSANESGRYCCSFCGVGDSVQFETETKRTSLIPAGEAVLRIESPEGMREYPASVTDDGLVSVRLDGEVPSGPIVSGRLSWDGGSRDVVGRVVTDET